MFASLLSVFLLGLPAAQASRSPRSLLFFPPANASVLCPLIPFANCTNVTASPLELSALELLGTLKTFLTIPDDVEARIKADLALLANLKLALEVGNLTSVINSQAEEIR